VPSRHATADCLTDIIENAERIAQYLSGANEAAFAGNGLVRDAVERCLERICKAAHRLGSNAAELMPDQLWDDIRGRATGCATLTIGSAQRLSGVPQTWRCLAGRLTQVGRFFCRSSLMIRFEGSRR
jgi:hypothetical protein